MSSIRSAPSGTAAIGVSQNCSPRPIATPSPSRRLTTARVAFPAISCGVYGYPLELGARVAIETVRTALVEHPTVVEARFWLFDDVTYAAFEHVLGA